MRLIGYLENEPHARTFADYLYVQGIETELEFQKGEGWAVWIRDEDKLDPAAKMFTGFKSNPADPHYRTEGKAASQLRQEEEQDQESYRKKLRSRRHLFRPLTSYGFGPLTFGLIAACVFVFLLSRFGTDFEPIRSLFISDRFGDRKSTRLNSSHLH